jgi:hypothetical protein
MKTERAAWNQAPWAKDAAGIAGESATSSFSAILDALKALAADRNADPDERSKAEAMLKTISADPVETAAHRNMATKALSYVASRRALDARMGLPWSQKAVRHEGRSLTFHAGGAVKGGR